MVLNDPTTTTRPYAERVLAVNVEPVTSPGPLSVIYLALDEFARRYGPGADADHLDLEEMVPREGSSSLPARTLTCSAASACARFSNQSYTPAR